MPYNIARIRLGSGHTVNGFDGGTTQKQRKSLKRSPPSGWKGQSETMQFLN